MLSGGALEAADQQLPVQLMCRSPLSSGRSGASLGLHGAACLECELDVEAIPLVVQGAQRDSVIRKLQHLHSRAVQAMEAD